MSVLAFACPQITRDWGLGGIFHGAVQVCTVHISTHTSPAARSCDEQFFRRDPRAPSTTLHSQHAQAARPRPQLPDTRQRGRSCVRA